MPVLNLGVIDTTPGSQPHSPFCPPVSWEGESSEAFLGLMRERFLDLELGQRMIVQSRYANNPEIISPVIIQGPFAKEVESILDRMT